MVRNATVSSRAPAPCRQVNVRYRTRSCNKKQFSVIDRQLPVELHTSTQYRCCIYSIPSPIFFLYFYDFARSLLFALILALLVNFKYRFISLSVASAISILFNLANVGNGFPNSNTHEGYSCRGLAVGTLDCDGSFALG